MHSFLALILSFFSPTAMAHDYSKSIDRSSRQLLSCAERLGIRSGREIDARVIHLNSAFEFLNVFDTKFLALLDEGAPHLTVAQLTEAEVRGQGQLPERLDASCVRTIGMRDFWSTCLRGQAVQIGRILLRYREAELLNTADYLARQSPVVGSVISIGPTMYEVIEVIPAPDVVVGERPAPVTTYLIARLGTSSSTRTTHRLAVASLWDVRLDGRQLETLPKVISSRRAALGGPLVPADLGGGRALVCVRFDEFQIELQLGDTLANVVEGAVPVLFVEAEVEESVIEHLPRGHVEHAVVQGGLGLR